MPSALLPENEALTQLLDAAIPPSSANHIEQVDSYQALGRILATPLVATLTLPAEDKSTMDGFAVNSQDISPNQDTCLHISQRIPAGTPPQPLQSGTAARIFTGANLPEGANCVIMQENCRYSREKVTVLHAELPRVNAGDNTLAAGSDVKTGQTLLDAGHKLRPQDLGLAASIGLKTLTVYRKLTVAILFTGSELRSPGEALKTGQIYNSSRYTLNGFLQALDCKVIDFGNIPDQRDQISKVLLQAANEADIIITSGGASVGEEDHMRDLVATLGDLTLWKLAIKPGKPLIFGHIPADDGVKKPIIGLPGNPVSSFVTFILYARPYILKSQGCTNYQRNEYPVQAGFEHKTGKRREFLRARLSRNAQGQLSANIHPNQSSAVFSSTSWAEGLVCIPEHSIIKKGDTIAYLSFNELS